MVNQSNRVGGKARCGDNVFIPYVQIVTIVTTLCENLEVYTCMTS